MRKLIILLCVFLFFSNIQAVMGARIHGSIYSIDLELQDKVVVEISTQPKQIFVSRNGSYFFEVEKGTYTIKAWQKQNDLFVQERISVKDEGSYNLDLILIPDMQEETILLNETEEDITQLEAEEKGSGAIITELLFLALIIIIFIAGFIFIIKTKSENNQKQEINNAGIAEKTVIIDKELNKIINFIKKEGGRTTQKEIRKILPLSEAKISLIISELEHKQLIQKIKKGRGNIIILK